MVFLERFRLFVCSWRRRQDRRVVAHQEPGRLPAGLQNRLAEHDRLQAARRSAQTRLPFQLPPQGNLPHSSLIAPTPSIALLSTFCVSKYCPLYMQYVLNKHYTHCTVLHLYVFKLVQVLHLQYMLYLQSVLLIQHVLAVHIAFAVRIAFTACTCRTYCTCTCNTY